MCPSFIKNCAHVALVKEEEEKGTSQAVTDFHTRMGVRKSYKMKCHSREKVPFELSPETAYVIREPPSELPQLFEKKSDTEFAVRSLPDICSDCQTALQYTLTITCPLFDVRKLYVVQGK